MKISVSACVITKNEEKNLPVCLKSIQSIVSEIIVVDTGSTDRTVQIAKEFGARVFSFEWIHDFAAARNYAIEQASSDWIIFLDADEYFSPDCVQYLPGAILEATQKELDMILCMMSHIEPKTGKLTFSNIHIRIFRNHPQIRYVGAIHERIVRMDKPAQALDVQQDITIIHTGYCDEDLHTKEKGKRNLEILFSELQKKPDSFDLLFYIAESYLVDKKYEEALEYAKRAQKYRNSGLKGVYEKNYVNIIKCLNQLGEQEKVILQTILEAIEEYPNYPDLYLLLGDAHKRSYRYRDAIHVYQIGVNLLNQSSIAQSNGYATAAKVLDSVGFLYSKLREWNQSVTYHVQALQIDKFLYTSLVNLISVLGRFEKPDTVVAFLDKIYERSNIRECLYLFRASLESNNIGVATILLKNLPEKDPALKEFKAIFDFLTGNYEHAYSVFCDLYRETSTIEYAYGALAAAWKKNNPNYYTDLQNLFSNDSELHQLTLNILGDTSQFNIDKKSMLMFLIYVCGTLKISDFQLLFDVVKKSNLYLEMAEYLYIQEKYVDAYQFYNVFLEQGEQLPSNRLAEITFKVGDCLLQCGLHEHAWAFLQKAHSLVPEDFRVYESLFELAKHSKRVHEVKSVLETAIRKYPDSNFLRNIKEQLILA
ncbi:glycosyltransferase family 2 protein [Brevibacillus sp. Leaf182]|uniref:glycosyltransferase family 2 protein n=1 Tax=Brevibacillus sp. Leaf182 TaxID=1736290 RepID=UPI0006F2D26C|nr:glycosyltransferase family 2 protein [Brevibacillus sp. Leaf182]RAT98716.1 hypothetical protein ASG16_003300 [Brevibacillus sp. Leaf182]